MRAASKEQHGRDAIGGDDRAANACLSAERGKRNVEAIKKGAGERHRDAGFRQGMAH